MLYIDRMLTASPSLSSSSSRQEVVDALRGFAVMAILLVHNLEHFDYFVYPDIAKRPEWINVLDKSVYTAGFALFAGKSYAIFSLLFGFTFYIQLSSRAAKGDDFGYRFLWRLLLLVLFAALNAAFFPGGDVLLLYSIVGIVLFVVRHWSDRAIAILCVFCLLQPVEWFHYIMTLVKTGYVLPDWRIDALYGAVGDNIKQGKLLPFIWGNLTVGQQASLFWAFGVGRYAQTAGLFLLGFLLARRQCFVMGESQRHFWLKVLIGAAIIFCPLYQLKVLWTDSSPYPTVRQTVGIVLDMWQKLSFMLVLVSSFVLLYQYEFFERITAPLRYYGRMSLTNYITQSILGGFIYFPIGLHLGPKTGYAFSILIAVAMVVLQVLACRWWLGRFKQGPLEGLWHKLTWIGKKD